MGRKNGGHRVGPKPSQQGGAQGDTGHNLRHHDRLVYPPDEQPKAAGQANDQTRLEYQVKYGSRRFRMHGKFGESV